MKTRTYTVHIRSPGGNRTINVRVNWTFIRFECYMTKLILISSFLLVFVIVFFTLCFFCVYLSLLIFFLLYIFIFPSLLFFFALFLLLFLLRLLFFLPCQVALSFLFCRLYFCTCCLFLFLSLTSLYLCFSASFPLYLSLRFACTSVFPLLLVSVAISHNIRQPMSDSVYNRWVPLPYVSLFPARYTVGIRVYISYFAVGSRNLFCWA